MLSIVTMKDRNDQEVLERLRRKIESEAFDQEGRFCPAVSIHDNSWINAIFTASYPGNDLSRDRHVSDRKMTPALDNKDL